VVKKGNAGEEVEEAEHKLAWIDRQLREEEQRRKQAEQVTQFRAKEKDAVKQGKKHYYPKKSEKRKEELVRKYQELKVYLALCLVHIWALQFPPNICLWFC
jgi:ribosomal RNA-processing protein 36